MSQRVADVSAWLSAFLRGASYRGRARQNEALIAAGMVTSLAYYYVVPLPLAALSGLLCFAALAWLRLDLALCLLPLTFPFWYVPKRVVGHVVFPLSEIALGVCIAVAVAVIGERIFRSRQRSAYLLRCVSSVATRVGRWLLIGAVLLLVGTAVGVVIARRPHEALRVWRWEVVEPLLYVLLVTAFVRRARLARWLVWSFLGSAVLVAVLATVQVLWLHVTFASLAQGSVLIPYSAPGGVPRATAFIFISGNTLGTWLARALPLALALAVAAGGGEGTRKAVWLQRERLTAAVCGVACVSALGWSASRGAWIAAGLACVVVVCLAWRRVVWPVVAVGVVGLLVALWQRETLAAVLLGGHGGTGEVRVLVWLAAWHMIRDHALLGIGPDQFLYYYSNLYTSHPYWIAVLNGHATLAAREPDLAQAHNLLLDLWLSGGLLALAGFIVALGVCWRRCLALWRVAAGSSGERLKPRPVPAGATKAANWEEAALPIGASNSQGQGAADVQLATVTTRWYAAAALGIGGMVLAGVLHGMVDNGYFAPDLALAFWWAVAVVIVLERGVLKRGNDAIHTSTGGAHRGAEHY